MRRATLKALLVFAAASSSVAALADDNEPPLFVADTGADRGDCMEAATPCRTIGYALRRVGKNGQVRVAAGTYELAAVEDVVYLVSGAIDVRGGYDADDGFTTNSDSRTTIVGAPADYVRALEHRGFRAIVDRKGLAQEEREKLRALVATQQSLKSSAPAAECLGGMAGSFPCSNLDLLAHVADRTPAATGADVWGFVDLNTHREYAIMGYSTGTAVFDVSDPEDPREVGFFDGQSTTWRDIKVYQFWNAAEQRFNTYAYITADNASDGLYILDFTGLPHAVSRIGYASDFAAAHNVYLTDTDFSTGLSITGGDPALILAGPSILDGRFRSYSLADPAAPVFTASPVTPPGQAGNDRLYMHDAASMIVTDARKDSQCVNATATHCEVLFDFNESTLDIWDVTDATDPVRLSQTPYANARYTHSGWWSEDKMYVFVQDELDERDRGLNTTLRAFSIADLASPVLAGSWTGPTRAIDHNGFVRGNRYYMSNYARGLTVLDISDPASPAEVGRFDTFPASDVTGFPGAWGTYPFLPSGNLLISDIDSGFYVVADNTLSVSQGALSFAAQAFGAEENANHDIVVRRGGGSQGAVSVRWELLSASATLDDVALASGSLSWAAGDSSDRSIDPGVVNDGVAEGLERLLIRLVAPAGGATLSAPSIASVYIGDPGATSTLDFAEANVAVAERGFGKAIATIRRTGSASGAVTADVAITAGDASAANDYSGPATQALSWADGDADPRTIEYSIVDDGSGESTEFFELALLNVSGASPGAQSVMRVDIVDGSGVNEAPNSIAGASQTVASGADVTLNGGQSNDPDGDNLAYAWTQTLGPTVTLIDADTTTATFTAPGVSSDTLLRFELRVSDPAGLTDTSVVSVTVSNSSAASGAGGGGGGSTSLWLLALLALARVIRRDVP